MLILGEVHTGLLQHSVPLSASGCESLLGFIRGEPVRRSERPISHAASPELLTGVDCPLPTGSGSRNRGVGTIRHRVTVTGGRVLQGSSAAGVVPGGSSRRLPWAHYLARPGVIELIGRAELPDLAAGFLTVEAPTTAVPSLDLGVVSTRAVDRVQTSCQLDRAPPFRTPRTRLRWVATAHPGPPRATFGVADGHWRTLLIECPEELLDAVVELAEDLALHDWLLTTLLRMIERSQLGTGAPGQVVASLRPAIDHLLHLWMPAARVHRDLLEVWESLERRPGFSRQWQASVDRIRDQVAVGTLALLTAAPEVVR